MNKKPVNLIVVDSDGEIITCANGKVSSDNPELGKKVKEAPFLPWKVQLVAPFGQKVRPSLNPDDLIGMTAAMYAPNPGRTRLLEAPAEVMEWFREEHANRGGGCLQQAPGKYTPRPLSDIMQELGKFGTQKSDAS